MNFAYIPEDYEIYLGKVHAHVYLRMVQIPENSLIYLMSNSGRKVFQIYGI